MRIAASPGPIATIQLANFRRGLQDHQYLTLARRSGLDEAGRRDAVAPIVPRVFSDAGDRVQLPETGDPYESGAADARSRRSSQRWRSAKRRSALPPPHRRRRSIRARPVRHARGRSHPGAMQIFPPDNPWNEDISIRPVHPDSAAIIASIGADTAAWLQPRHELRDRAAGPAARAGARDGCIRTNRIRARFRFPTNAPIENWPLARNEDHGALPKPGVTLEQFQRDGTGDRHLILVDPGNGQLHEFWQARLTDDGWEASQASTFDLTSNRLRPERLDVCPTRPACPIFPAVVRYDEVARGLVRPRACASPSAGRGAPMSTRRATSPARIPIRRCRAWASGCGCAATSTRPRFPPHAQAILEGLKTLRHVRGRQRQRLADVDRARSPLRGARVAVAREGIRLRGDRADRPDRGPARNHKRVGG